MKTICPKSALRPSFAAALFLIAAASACMPASAAGVRYQKGEGGRGTDAFLDLDPRGQVTLGMMACEIGPKTANLMLGLFKGPAERTAPGLDKLWNAQDNAKLDIKVCVAEHCQDRRWEYRESGNGDAFFTSISIAGGKTPMRSIRIKIPGASAEYAYRGDVASILQRICE